MSFIFPSAFLHLKYLNLSMRWLVCQPHCVPKNTDAQAACISSHRPRLWSAAELGWDVGASLLPLLLPYLYLSPGCTPDKKWFCHSAAGAAAICILSLSHHHPWLRKASSDMPPQSHVWQFQGLCSCFDLGCASRVTCAALSRTALAPPMAFLAENTDWWAQKYRKFMMNNLCT